MLLPLTGIRAAQEAPRVPEALSPSATGHVDETLGFLTWTPPATDSRPSFVLPARRQVASAVDDNGQIFPEVEISAERRQLLERYRRALALGNQEACPEFQKLADDTKFDRRAFARLRFWIHCSALVKPQDRIDDVDVSALPVLQTLKDEAEMIVAERQGRWPRYLELLSDRIRESRIPREKTKYLEMAVQIAETKDLPQEAARLRRDLEKFAPRFRKSPKPGEFLEVGQDFIQAREFDKGRQYLRRVWTSKFSKFNDQRKARQAYRNSFKIEQNKSQHLVEAEEYYDWLVKNKEWGLAFDSGLYWVRALWTDGQKGKAQNAMNKMAKLFAKRGGRLFELEFIRGRMDEEDADFNGALAHYEKALAIVPRGTSHAIKVEASRAWALRRLGRDLEAATAFETLAANAPEPGDQLRARFWQGKSLVKAGQTEKAQQVFRQVAFDDPVGYYGLIAFRELEHAIPPLSASREESLKGWNALREELEKAQQAAQLDDDVAAHATSVTADAAGSRAPGSADGETDVAMDDPNLAPPTRGHATQAVADREVAPTVGSLKTADPSEPSRGQAAPTVGSVVPGAAAAVTAGSGRSSSEASARTANTREPDSLNDASEVASTPAPRALTLPEKTWITELNLMGEKKLLEKYLDGLAAAGGWNYTEPEGFALLKAYARAGLYLPLFATIGKIEKSQREALLLNHPELLFPMDYAATIKHEAARQAIPAELVFSIIRQESAFDPNARSFADAMGLMQVLPTQAKVVAKELGLEFRGHDDLYRPELNIPVGAKMLRQGLDRYDGNFILAIASYNANDRAIKGWLKSRFREDPAEFIEEIAYEETRTYVKLVLRNYIFYKRLANPETALTFPPECLPDLQKFKHSADEKRASL